MRKIRKAVIPAAGLGTRFLPATKTVPKEMLTVVDAPIIFYVVEEAIRAGIEDIILIQGRGKTAIEDFFDVSYELENHLLQNNKMDLLKRIVHIRDMANIISVRQKQPLGLGHAVLTAEKVIGEEPFAVLLGDEMMLSPNDADLPTAKLIQSFESNGASTVAVMKVEKEEVRKYGVADVSGHHGELMRVQGFVEKPSPERAPSLWALPGRYVFTPQIFKEIRETRQGVLGEIQLTDAMNQLAKKDDFYASPLVAKRFDAGDKLGYLKANLEIGLQHAELASALKDYLLQDLLPRLEQKP